ncbi:MAG TPA: hypothetical protein VF292_06355 [Rhodanobacteraceae bacterium]
MIAFEATPRDVKIVTCDRCGKALREDRPFEGYANRTQIRFRAGYGSLFGDGNKIEGDLCDACLYELLGPYLRVVAPSPAEARAASDDPSSPLEACFDYQARRLYAPYQTPWAIAENVALALREWIDTCFDLKWKRAPLQPPRARPDTPVSGP